MAKPRMIDQFAARQYGAFSLAQAKEAGYDKAAVHRRLESGAWIRLDHRVYAVASSPPKWERHLAAAVLSRPRAVLSHVSAAHLLGMKGFERTKPAILVPRGSNTRSEIARIYETDEIETIALTRVNGFEVTTVPETLLVLARDLAPLRLEDVFDHVLLDGRLDLATMLAILEREAGRRPRGVARLRDLTYSRLPAAPTKDSTYLEAMLERVLHLAHIPRWTREYQFRLTRLDARVDVYVPSWRLVIEADGRNWHMKRRDFETDRQRDNSLASIGIQVLRYTYQALNGDTEAVVAEIQRVGAVRAAQGVA